MRTVTNKGNRVEILENSTKPYTAAAAAKLRMSVSKVLYQRPDVSALLYDLESFDISTNKFYFTTHQTVPIGGVHPTMGLVVQRHPDIADAIELVSIQIGTAAHKHIRSWKRNLHGSIITAINGISIKSRAHIISSTRSVRQARKSPSKRLNEY